MLKFYEDDVYYMVIEQGYSHTEGVKENITRYTKDLRLKQVNNEQFTPTASMEVDYFSRNYLDKFKMGVDTYM